MKGKSAAANLAFVAAINLVPTAAVVSCKRPWITVDRDTSSLRAAVSLESATNDFFTEYGKLPGEQPRLTTDSPEGRQFLTVLLGLEKDPEKPLNTLAVKFLALREGKDKRNGLIYSASGEIEGLYDTWGNPYVVVLDSDNDAELHFTSGSKAVDMKNRRVAVFSAGPDKRLGTSDDVRTWGE